MNSHFSFFKKQGDKTLALAKVEKWFDSPKGKSMQASQQKILDEILSNRFGYYLVQLSVDSRIQLYNSSRVQHKFRCHPSAMKVDAHCDFQQLPFATDSIDVIVLHHSHEYVDNPHQLLREIHRVMVPHGQLIIVGFNPWSIHGLYSHIGRFVESSVWQNQLISSHRMKDWLDLLGYKTDSCHFGNHSPQLIERTKNASIARFLSRWPLGNFYLISAVKEQAGLTPLRPVWKSSKRPFGQLSPIKKLTHEKSDKPLPNKFVRNVA